MVYFLKRCSDFFRSKKVIVVSDFGIKTRQVTSFSKCLQVTYFLWFVFATIMFVFNTKIQLNKDKVIDELKTVNANLSNRIVDIESIVDDVNGYLLILNSYDRFNDINIKNANSDQNRIKSNFYSNIEEYKKILPVLNNLERGITNMEILVSSRIKGLDNILKDVSLNNNAKELYNINYKITDSKKSENIIFKNSILVKRGDFFELRDNIKYMSFLESFLNSVPIAKPMKHYYISSKFGSRVDPFTKKVKTHNGLDFVGPYGSVIYAPADGVVDIVAKRGGFGNSIEIDHGNDIKTEYAHLDSSLVKVGDIVKRGDKIAIQGNTGRSTGQHLHWEVRVKRKNVDPMKFIKVGEKLF